MQNLKQKQLVMQKIEVFDFNVHLTVDGSFNDYRRNMPAKMSCWRQSKYVLPIGGNICGLKGIGGYNYEDFLKIVLEAGSRYVSTMPWSIDMRPVEYDFLKKPEVVILKLHPRSLNKSIFDFDYLKILETCRLNGIAFGLCTYFGDRKLDNEEIALIRSIVKLFTKQNIVVVFFHAFGLDFKRLWCEFGDNELVYFDTSFSIVRYRDDFTDNLMQILEVNPKNVMFGSDFPDYSLDEVFGCLPSSILGHERFLKLNAIQRFSPWKQ